MGNLCLRPDRNADKLVSQQLSKLNRKEERILKILLLGTGDSGKTTIFKQMRYLYGQGVGPELRKQFRKAIFQCLIDGTRVLSRNCGKLEGTSNITAENSLSAVRIIEQATVSDRLAKDVAASIFTLWKDPNFQTAWDHRSKLDVIEAYGIFAPKCEKYPEWGGDSWIPDREDYLLGRIRTSGMVTESFMVGDTTLRFVDVGGQRNERRKWIHCFQDVTAVLFVVASSEYDQVLFESKETNRLVEALDLFESITNADYFHDTTMILFLNKADILREKLEVRQIPLNASGLFPNAPTTFNFKDATDWMIKEFLSKDEHSEKIIYTHITTALDESNMKVVIEAVKKTILKQVMKGFNFY